jgi:protein-S-isoprenylcysteine O-methyltransferase Ste14
MRRPPYVLAWWLFNFVAVGVIIVAYIIASPEAEVATRAPEMSWFVVVQVIITVIGSWLTIKVVREIDMRQAKKIELVRSGGYGTP